MANPLKKIVENPVVQERCLHIGVAAVGIVLDFWKDGSYRLPSFAPSFKKQKGGEEAPVSPSSSVSSSPRQKKSSSGPKLWTADHFQVMEKIWGEGRVLPGDKVYLDNLVAPLGLDETMSVLDLSAGLGGLARKLAFDFNTYVTGLEPSAACASRGMVMSIAAGKSKQAGISVYDPATYEAARKYDCIIARELFYRVIGKARFFKAVNGSFKAGRVQIVFTDYILDPKDREVPAVAKWLAFEKEALPSSLSEMLKEWRSLGFEIRVAEDQTALYKREILRGLAKFADFLSKNQAAPETKGLIGREIEKWACRVAALEGGLKYYRFYGVKHKKGDG